MPTPGRARLCKNGQYSPLRMSDVIYVDDALIVVAKTATS